MAANQAEKAVSESDRTTIWLCITALCIGGAERTLVDLANGLDKSRYDVTVWTIFSLNPLAKDLDTDVTVRSLTGSGRVRNGAVVGVTNPFAYLLVPLRFCLAAYREQPDVIQAFLLLDNLLARFAGLVTEATIITGVRSVPNDPSPVRVLADQLTISLSDHIVSNSEAGRTLAIDRGASPDAVSVIRNGRDSEQYRTADPEPVERELEIGDEEIVVGTIGRLIERKGHFELISAWSQIQERETDMRLVIVGDGADRDALEAHARAEGCHDSVEFLGTRHDVPALLAAMDVFAFPSHFEGLPGAVVEAMAAGLPIVATPVDGTAELLDNYETGLFVSVEAPAELAWAITRLVETPELRESLGAAARERMLAEYTIDVMVDNFESLYEQIEPAPDTSERPVPVAR